MKKLQLLSITLFIFLWFIWIPSFIWFFTYSVALKAQSPRMQTDAIVVLTGGDRRIEEGLKLYADGLSKNIFITGVHGDVSFKKIESMWEGDLKLPECCLDIDYNARSTIENAQETKTWLLDKDYKTVRLVTSDYHMPRAMLEFETIMPNIDFIPHTVPANVTNNDLWASIRIIFKEYHKYLFRLVMHSI